VHPTLAVQDRALNTGGARPSHWAPDASIPLSRSETTSNPGGPTDHCRPRIVGEVVAFMIELDPHRCTSLSPRKSCPAPGDHYPVSAISLTFSSLSLARS